MDDKILLEDFLLRNEELDRLESMVSEFNFFEVLEIIDTEIRHSNVLSWLLDPNGNHGLGDHFLRSFLKHLFYNNRDSIHGAITFFDIEVFSFDDIEIRREWKKIDLLILSRQNKMAVAIENKVRSEEHGDQLTRYAMVLKNEFPGYHNIFVYLTPEGLTPRGGENWIIFDYATIHSILSDLLNAKKSSLGVSIFDFMNQYTTILRRYVMENSEIVEICRIIYQKHKQALDLIYQYKPDIFLEISEHVAELIKSQKNLVLDKAGKSEVIFTTKVIDDLIPKVGEGWTTGNRILVFNYYNEGEKQNLRLIIGPGDSTVRRKIQEIAQKDPKRFNLAKRKLTKKWLTIYQKEFFRKGDFNDKDTEELKDSVSKKFDKFVKEDLGRIEEHFRTHWE